MSMMSPAAFCLASLLAFLALVTLGFKSWLEWRSDRGIARQAAR